MAQSGHALLRCMSPLLTQSGQRPAVPLYCATQDSAVSLPPKEFDKAATSRRKTVSLQKFIIERDIPKVGAFERDQLRGAAAKSNEVLRRLGPDIQWVESYVADNKTFCVYLAKDEAIIREHAAISGFPATKVTAVKKMIDPTTEAA
jgi:Protein of unknown function (DUF4242)